MTVVESPKGRASHNLGNRGAIPPFPPPGYCYIFFQNLSRKEPSSPPVPSRFRLILRLEKTTVQVLVPDMMIHPVDAALQSCKIPLNTVRRDANTRQRAPCQSPS